MNDALKRKLISNPELKNRIDSIANNHFPLLQENARVEIADLQRNKITLQRIKKAVMNLDDLTETEKEEVSNMLSARYIDFLNEHNKKFE